MAELEKIECSICGKRFAADLDKELLIYHVMSKHPLEIISHPTFIKNMSEVANKTGAMLGDLMKGVLK